MSHASLRDLAARPFLGTAFLDEVALQLAVAGFDLVRMENYVVVQRARMHESVRRVPAGLRENARDAAIAEVAEIRLPATSDADGDD